MASHLPEFGLELVHPPSKPTAVGLQRLLARTASGASEATGLLGERPAAALQSGRQIAKLGQLDLGLALLARGVLGEDVQDHRSTVDRGAAEQLLQLELLGRAQLVVEDDRVTVGGFGERLDLGRLAGSDVGGRVGGATPLGDATHHVGARRVDEQCQFVQGILDGAGAPGAVDGDGDQQDPLPVGSLDETSGLTTELAKTTAVRILGGLGRLDDRYRFIGRIVIGQRSAVEILVADALVADVVALHVRVAQCVSTSAT